MVTPNAPRYQLRTDSRNSPFAARMSGVFLPSGAKTAGVFSGVMKGAAGRLRRHCRWRTPRAHLRSISKSVKVFMIFKPTMVFAIARGCSASCVTRSGRSPFQGTCRRNRADPEAVIS